MNDRTDVLADEARKYAQAHPVLLRLGSEFCQKYRSLGHFGGIVSLSRLSLQEQQDLSSFLRRETAKEERVSFKELSSAWQKTRFSVLSLDAFLLSLMPKGFSTKQEEREKENRDRLRIYERLCKAHSVGPAAQWLEALHRRELRLAQREFYHQEDLLGTVACALASLPETYERLPLFAHRIAGNPHALDFDRPAGRLFLQALAFLAGEPVPVESDERTQLMYQFRILRDDILNFATVYGLAAYGTDGVEIPYWRDATKTCSPLNIPLREIVLAERIIPVGDDCRIVYIVENSGVFSALVDALQARKRILSLLALHGQLKAASWALLDRLAKGGTYFLYSGDFDPEGIGIAHRILSRYANAKLWHMFSEEYQRAAISLPENRWKKLPAQVHPQLEALVRDMQKRKKVLYQESLVEDLEKDILGS